MANSRRTSSSVRTAPPSTPRAATNQTVLASLRAAQMVSSSIAPADPAQKPVLPAEIINMILNYLSVSDLFSFARTSRRMQEMVYDDTRWVQRLQSMGVWNEAEARQRVEDAMSKKGGATLNGRPVRQTATERRKPSLTLFDAGQEEHQKPSLEHHGRKAQATVESGFDAPALITAAGLPSHQSAATKEPVAALKILSKVRSIRGCARQEYGRVYGTLAPFYFDLAESRTHGDPILFRTYREPEQQVQMLSQLRLFSKTDWAQGWHVREQKLVTMIAMFENAVIAEFEQGMQAADYGGRMKRYANVLVTLNGGMSAVDTFIQNNPVMLRKDRFGNPLDCTRTAFSGHINLTPSEQFYTQLATVMNEQIAIIDVVFPPAIDVLSPFMEKIGEEVISEYITTLFDETQQHDTESYLKAVAGIFEQALRFSISIQKTKAYSGNFAQFSKSIIVKTFEQHVDLYLREEIDFFNKKSQREVDIWEQRLQEQEASTESFFLSNVSRQAAKQDFLSSFRKMVMLPVNAVGSLTTTTSSKRSVARDSMGMPSNRPSTPNTFERTGTPGQDAPTSELAAKAAIMNSRLEGIRSLFSIEVALKLVHSAKASLERAAIFVKAGGQIGEEAREQCEAVFVSLLKLLGDRHIKRGFDKAVNHLSSYNPRDIGDHGGRSGVEPLVTFLELVNVGDLIQQMVDVFYVQELISTKLTDSDDFLSPAVKEKKRFEQMLDERVAAGLNKGIDVLMDEVEYICATTQAPNYFNPQPGPDGRITMTDIGPSLTAIQVIDVVSQHVSMLVGSTDKNVLDVFNQEVGVRLFTVLCKHFKRQRISTDGAIRLISDTNHYHSYISSMKNKTLNEYFNAMRELSQIYLVSPRHAKEIGVILADQDRYKGIFTPGEMYEFAERRADWFQVKRDVEKTMYGMGCIVM